LPQVGEEATLTWCEPKALPSAESQNMLSPMTSQAWTHSFLGLSWMRSNWATTVSIASFQEISFQPGSSSIPFFGLVRFSGTLTRFGLYRFMKPALPLAHILPRFWGLSGLPSIPITTPFSTRTFTLHPM